MPEGQMVISGFNPACLWRLRQIFSFKKESPWEAKFIGLLRLREWLRVLGFELNGGKFGCYAPPFRQRLWLERLALLGKARPPRVPPLRGLHPVRAGERADRQRP